MLFRKLLENGVFFVLDEMIARATSGEWEADFFLFVLVENQERTEDICPGPSGMLLRGGVLSILVQPLLVRK